METPELVPGVQLGGRRRDRHQATVGQRKVCGEALPLFLEGEREKTKRMKIKNRSEIWDGEKEEEEELESEVHKWEIEEC